MTDDVAPGEAHSCRNVHTVRGSTVIELGLTNAKIAECLGLSPRTVQSHLRHALAKFGLLTRAVREVQRDGDGVLPGANKDFEPRPSVWAA